MLKAACGSLGRGYGEIGRHARFRFWCRKAWEFKSLYPHQVFRAGVCGTEAKPFTSLLAPYCLAECLRIASQPRPGNHLDSGVVLGETNRLPEHGRHDMKVRTCRLSKRSLKG